MEISIKRNELPNKFPGGIIDKRKIYYSCYKKGRKSLVLRIFHRIKKEYKKYCDIKLNDEYLVDDFFSVVISGISTVDIAYVLLENNKEIVDEYAYQVFGLRNYGEKHKDIKYGFLDINKYEIHNNRPFITEHEAIMYNLHVRGFSKNNKKDSYGTFKNITERKDYFLELGINQILLMPAYEFDEIEKDGSINYWGYKEGYYFALKSSYSGHKDLTNEFHEMVDTLHKNGIEIIMEFYFTKTINPLLIIQVLLFWKKFYNIDGAFLMGPAFIPWEVIANHPQLHDFKIYGNYIDKSVVLDEKASVKCINDEFLYVSRRFANTKENVLGNLIPFYEYNKDINVSYLALHDGFTLYDSVSYTRKHNEANKENGRDGSDYNVSCNYGVEGVTKNKVVLDRRLRKIKALYTLLFLAKDIPVIFSGDECLNSQAGNNNPYCQDNNIGWISFNNSKRALELQNYIKKLILFRKSSKIYEIIPNKSRNKGKDKLPDISFHQDYGWYVDYERALKYFGILFVTEDKYYYAGVNFENISRKTAIPNIDNDKKWKLVLNSAGDDNELQLSEKYLTVDTDSVIILERER
ncbi:glycogen operon protein [Acetitomaculum ruminis DSM 5522]|uniref:Glycogen operon protein n=1 Tax=Acetitomaculum ruminis DSM 5522 TaxID=1120918 RepID=A0A1I0VLB0_9FIRM|nr:alpha-amylase family glycosyl hydrolase [Acetitomaculum ruminis]SFA77259.1 glycogen operon protein [Acetitomaculum ruminis DSM 5522]